MLFNALPPSSGPYDVGSIDLEIPVERQDFGIIRNGKPMLVLETVLVTIFYPIKLGSGASRAPDGRKEWSRQLWLTKNRSSMARGYGHFSHVPKPLCQFFFTTSVGLTKLPAWRNAPLAEHFPAAGNLHENGPDIRDREAEDPLDRLPIFPVIYFSHGLGGNRTTYSSICSEYAAYGWVCCAIEHRDGSGPRTYVNYSDGRSPRRVDYIHPLRGNDTANDDEVETDHGLRDAQLRMRKCEIAELHKFMCRLSAGEGSELSKLNLLTKTRHHVIGGSSRGTIGVDWSTWKGRLRLQNVTMCGHSFGGATAICVLRTPAMLEYIKYGIIMDVWGQGLPLKPLADEQEHMGTPVLAMGSESFLYWEENLKMMFDLCKDTLAAQHKFWIFTIRGSFHMSFSDFCILWPNLSRIMFRTNIPPQRVIDIVINSSLEYFKLVMPAEMMRWNRGMHEGLLESPISDSWRDVEGARNAWRDKMGSAEDDGDTEVWMHYSSSCDDGRNFDGLRDHKKA